MKSAQKNLALRRRGSYKVLRKIKHICLWGAFLLVVTLAVAAFLVYKNVDSQLRNAVARSLNASYPDFEVSFKDVRLDSNRGVRIHNLEWRKRRGPKDATPLLAVEEIYVASPISPKTVLRGVPKILSLNIKRPVLNVEGGVLQLRDALAELIPMGNSQLDPNFSVQVDDAALLLGTTNFSGLALSIAPRALRPLNPNDANPPQSSQTPLEEEAPLPEISLYQSVAPAVALDSPNSARYGFVSYQPSFEVESQPEETLPSASNSPQKAGGWEIKFFVSNPYVESIRGVGELSEDEWSLSGSVANFDLAALVAVARSAFPEQLKLLEGAQGKTSLSFSLGSKDDSLEIGSWKIEGSLANAALSSPILNYPASDVNAFYLIENDKIELRRATAVCGQSSVKAAFQSVVGQNSFARVQFDNISVSDSVFADTLRRAQKLLANDAPKINKLLDFLADYSFEGKASFDVQMEKSSAADDEWAPRSVVASVNNLSFYPIVFPYPLEELHGTLSLNAEGALAIDLASAPDAPPIVAQGFFADVMTNPRGQFDARVDNRAIDARVLNALPSQARTLVDSLHPSGAIGARVRILYDKDARPEEPLAVEAAVDLSGASLRYDYFPLPISGVAGKIFLRDEAWAISQLSGKSGGAALAAAGSLVSGKGFSLLRRAFERENVRLKNASANLRSLALPEKFPLLLEESPAPLKYFTGIPEVAGAKLPAEDWRFLLAANVRRFPLGEELIAALEHYDGKELLKELKLEGKADGQIRVGFRTDENRLALQFDAQPIPGSTSFQPNGFPYPLSDVEGKVSWREGRLTISDLRARSGVTTCSANVVSQNVPGVGRVVDVSPLRVDQLQVDRDLQSVAGKDTQKFLSFLKPVGFFNVDGSVRITSPADPAAKRKYAWNLRFIAQQNSTLPGEAVAAICGRFRTYGVALQNTSPLIYGELDLDSFFYKDAQVSNMRGPLYYNGADFFWGTDAPLIRNTPVYSDPFVREKIDADPTYQILSASTSPRVLRGQTQQTISRDFLSSQTSSDASSSSALSARKAPSNFDRASGLRSIEADVFGGRISCDGVYLGAQDQTYRLNAKLENSALDQALRVFAPGSKPLKGRVNMSLALQGEGKNTAALKGEGSVEIREAQLYELPQIVKILSLLSVKNPGENAFGSCDVDFKVLSDHVKLTRVLLEGDALTLFGDGWLTIRGKEQLVDLTLNSRLGNQKSQIPILSDVIGAAGDQIAQIRVEGNLASPVIQQENLPGLKKAWWSIFPEQEPTPEEAAPEERAKPVRDAIKKFVGGSDKNE